MASTAKMNGPVALLVLGIYLFLFVSGIRRQVKRQQALRQSVQHKSALARLRR